ncbi:LacI family DNA-binding transcriptional regulator [Pseudonocardia sp. HH130630-07]|uniref:LacI family DNA-binding transcriptional regulator n=1 Tax=Pseudonocardia sp. HH130630-07 TaxID=1690815 RepID=UPI0008152489|nr:substrate-binding domain-containing protein [Pseudonocardia sp. HH130630-07]ANY05947.1 transcriptional regulator [Pseudonocardia sp. HH130630-07]
MTTIRDVAARAGVSLGTASRVLAGSSATSAEARERVAAAVTELGYLPNARAGSLRRARTDTVGILISDVRNPFFAELAHAAEREALRRGSVVMLANADEDAGQERTYLRAFGTQRVDGVLLAPQSSDPAHFAQLRASGVPVVCVDRVVPGLDVPCVVPDNAGGVRAAVALLVGRGHHRVGYVGGPASVSTGRERVEAFLAERDARGLPADPRLVEEGDFRSDSGAVAVGRMLDAGAAPTAVLVADGLMTLGALAELRRRGLRPAVELVSFDDSPWFAEVEPPVSAVANDATRMGRRGMELLLDAVERARDGGPAPDPATVVVPTRLVDRSRTGPPPPTPTPRGRTRP